LLEAHQLVEALQSGADQLEAIDQNNATHCSEQRSRAAKLATALVQARSRVERALRVELKTTATELKESTRGLNQLSRLRQMTGYQEARRLTWS